MAKLAALVPRPKTNLTRFHGMLARSGLPSNSRYLERVTTAGRTVYILDDDKSFTESLAFLLADKDYTLSSHNDPVGAIDSLKTISTFEPACLLLVTCECQ